VGTLEDIGISPIANLGGRHSWADRLLPPGRLTVPPPSLSQGRQRRGGWGGDASPHHFGQGDPMPLIPLAAVAIGFNDLHL